MSFVARLQRAREVLEQQGRLSVRALGRELECSGDELDEIVEELIEVQGVAAREGAVLVHQEPSRGIPRPRPDVHQITDAVALLKKARKPLIIAGGGVRYSEAEVLLSQFATGHNIPVTETLVGRTMLLHDHPMNAGPIGGP